QHSHATLSYLFLLRHPTPPPRSTLFPYTTLFRSCVTHVLRELPDQPYMSIFFKSAESFRHTVLRFKYDHRFLTVQPSALVRNSRSEEHTSELQSRFDLVCRLLLENKKRTLIRTAG